MILLNSEKQCIYMHRGRWRRRRMAGRKMKRRRVGVREEEEVSLCVIMTNTEIFHIFHIISLFSLPVQSFDFEPT